MPALNLQWIAPLIALTVGALIVIILDLTLPRPAGARFGLPVAFLSVLAAAGLVWSAGPGAAFAGAYDVDPLARALQTIILITTGLALALSLGRTEEDVPGYLALLLWAASGMMVFVAAGNLLVAFLGLELFSLALYVLVAFQRRDELAREGALKYFLLGGAASGVLLFGFAFVYGSTGAVGFADIARAIVEMPPSGLQNSLRAGLALSMIGFAFKLALVPFHAWAPDAYQAAPTPVTAFMSIATKTAAFGALLRFFLAVAPGAEMLRFAVPVGLLGALSMAAGSLAGLGQSNLKRLLAYSGIASAGYLTLALPAARIGGADAAAFYLLAYLFANVGAFGVVAWLEGAGGAASVADLAGLYRRRPWLAAGLTVSAFSLIGLPPSGGFTGKVMLVAAGVRAALAEGAYPGTWIPVAGLLITTGISAYVYLRMVGAMFLGQPGAGQGRVDPGASAEVASAQEPVPFSSAAVRTAYAAVIAVCAIGTIWLGLLPQPLATALSGLVGAR